MEIGKSLLGGAFSVLCPARYGEQAAMATAMNPERRGVAIEGEMKYAATKADVKDVEIKIEKAAAVQTRRTILIVGGMQALGSGALLQFLPRT